MLTLNGCFEISMCARSTKLTSRDWTCGGNHQRDVSRRLQGCWHDVSQFLRDMKIGRSGPRLTHFGPCQLHLRALQCRTGVPIKLDDIDVGHLEAQEHAFAELVGWRNMP